MGILGPLPPGTVADDSSVGTVAFSNVANVLSSDDTYASAVLLLSQTSHYLKATNFGFAIPLDATIDGVQVDIERSANVLSGAQDVTVKLVKAGSVVGTNLASGSTWPSSDGVATYGSSTNLWGTTLTPADINAADFGVVINATALLGVTASIDAITMTVTYTGSNRFGNSRYFGAGNMSTTGRAL